MIAGAKLVVSRFSSFRFESISFFGLVSKQQSSVTSTIIHNIGT
jgi:hypothetical protein